MRSPRRGFSSLAMTWVVALTLAAALARPASAQSPAPASPLGTWRGTSRCLVRPSPCNDEVVVYRITATTGDSLAIDARKIVRGAEEEMGVLACSVDARSGDMICEQPRGVWRFSVRGDSLTGGATLRDGTRYRVVRTARAPQ